METNSKKIFLVIGIIGVVGVSVLLGTTENFFGKLVFFKDSQTKEKVIDKAFVSYKDAFELLKNAAEKTGKADKEKIKKVEQEVQKIADNQITREEFAILAVQIFNIREYGYGSDLNDVDGSKARGKAVYLFTSNGGIDSDFKPQNLATDTFARKAAENLTKRMR